jgi:hypothetical protein
MDEKAQIYLEIQEFLDGFKIEDTVFTLVHREVK